MTTTPEAGQQSEEVNAEFEGQEEAVALEVVDGTTKSDDTESDDTAAGDNADDPTPDDVTAHDSTAHEVEAVPARRTRSSVKEDLIREGEIAADFLETLLDIADLDGDLEVDIEGNRAAVAIVDSEDGEAPRNLVGPGARVLDALQELTRLAVQAETGDRSRLMLDVAGYRADRRAALVRTAQRFIDQVKEAGEQVELEPMTAFERKVIHDEVLAAGLHSESDGVEPQRYVVIYPAS